MPLQQFDEYAPLFAEGYIDDSATPMVPVTITDTNLRQRVDSIIINSNDTIDHVVALCIGTEPLLSVNVPAGAGFGGVPAVDVFKTISTWSDLDHLTFPTQGVVLKAYAEEAVQSGKVVRVHCIAGLV